MTKRQFQRKARAARRKAGKKWKDLTPEQQGGVVVGSVVQLTLLAMAQIDITRRPADQIRGGKLLWRILTLINFLGPLAYFAIGRKKPAPPETPETEHQPESVVA